MRRSTATSTPSPYLDPPFSTISSLSLTRRLLFCLIGSPWSLSLPLSRSRLFHLAASSTWSRLSSRPSPPFDERLVCVSHRLCVFLVCICVASLLSITELSPPLGRCPVVFSLSVLVSFIFLSLSIVLLSRLPDPLCRSFAIRLSHTALSFAIFISSLSFVSPSLRKTSGRNILTNGFLLTFGAVLRVIVRF